MNPETIPSLVKPPTWSLFVGGLGSYLVLGATALYVLSVIAWLFFPTRGKRVGSWALTLGSVSLLGSFIALAVLFIANRFEYQYVAGHGDSKNAIPYRIAGIWSGQQGSFLLWGVCSAIFVLLVARHTDIYRRWFSVACGVFLGCIAAILAFESPFLLNTIQGQPFVPLDGVGMAPSLQNYWVTIHPPTIFMGFGSLTVLFALSFAALITRDFEKWVPIMRPWAIVSMSLVGVGLCMGGFWAYETLGWGGFWMWDPVENTSFVPWCFTVALTHGLLVQATRKKWQISNMLLAGLAFLTFMYGTFLTRSGFLADASVHSFAEMDRSALKLLIGLVGSAFGFFGIAWGVRVYQERRAAKADEGPGALKRDNLMKLGIISISVLGLATAVGMSVPFFMALSGKPPKVVEEGLYHQVIPWFYVPIMLLLAVAPTTAWKAASVKEFAGKVYSILCAAIGLTGLTVFIVAATSANREITLNPILSFFGHKMNGLPWLLFLIGLSYFAIVGNVWRMGLLWRGSKIAMMPYLTHIGVSLLMTGLIVSRGFERVDQTMVMADRPGQVLDYVVSFKGMTSTVEDRDNHARFEFALASQPGKKLFEATPGLYNVHTEDGQTNVMVWPHIQKGIFEDVYISLRPPQTTPMGKEFTLKPGEQVNLAGRTYKYIGLDRQGQPGAPGTKFGAKIQVTTDGKTEDFLPQLEIGQPGTDLKHLPAQIAPDLVVDMNAMNVADKSVTLDVGTSATLYPLEVFHKPLTILVWLGAGLMGVAGFFAAWNRRSRRRLAPTSAASEEESASTRKLAKIA